jgi:hypothetical protein
MRPLLIKLASYHPGIRIEFHDGFHRWIYVVRSGMIRLENK